MKKLVFVLFLFCSISWSQGTQLNVYDYQLNANNLITSKNGKIGLLTAKYLVSDGSTADDQLFGFWISNNTNVNSVFLEIREGTKIIAAIKAKEFLEKSVKETVGDKTISTYTSGAGSNAVVLSIESAMIADSAMPLGKAVQIIVKAKTASTKNLIPSMTLFADGFVTAQGKTGVSNSRVDKGKAAYPLLLLVGEGRTTVSTDKVMQRSPGKLVKITSPAVQSAGTEVVLLSFRSVMTTVKNFDKSAKQASNLSVNISTKKAVTEMSLLNSVDKAKPTPGDTITYTITYHNIGNAPARDIVINNPLPAKTTYLDDSAFGESSEITLNRKNVPSPQVGEVTSVSWKITRLIWPGEEGTVSFKAIIQ